MARALLLAMALLLSGCASLTGGATQDGQVTPTLRLARAALAGGQLNTAIALYRDAASAPGADDSVLVEFANALNDAGAPEDALDVASQVPERSASRAAALLSEAHAHVLLREADQALQDAEQAEKLAPGDMRAELARGVALDMLERHTEAQAAYHRVLAQSPRSIAARNDLALSLALSGQFSQALEIIGPMARSMTATPRLRQNLALIYGLMGDKRHAEAMSRVDLDVAATAANLHFFDLVRTERCRDHDCRG